MELTALRYAGRVFRPVGWDGPDVPLGRYAEHGVVVSADISGGPIRRGHLVGCRRPDGTIDATYYQVMVDGRVVAGRCVSKPSVLPDGRVRLTEYWRRRDGSSGVSRIEEVER